MEKVDDLSGSELDHFVAQAEEIFYVRMDDGFIIRVTEDNRLYYTRNDGRSYPYAPSADWRQGGTILQSAGISVEKTSQGWQAHYNGTYVSRGETVLEAAMRTRVKMKFGDLVDPG